PNPEIDFVNSPFFVNSTLRPWGRGELPRLAGVNALGIGGTNVHVIVEEAPVVGASGPSRSWQLIPLSAKTPTALADLASNLARHIELHPELNLADIAHTLQQGRREFKERMLVLSNGPADAVELLRSEKHARIIRSNKGAQRPI